MFFALGELGGVAAFFEDFFFGVFSFDEIVSIKNILFIDGDVSVVDFFVCEMASELGACAGEV